MDGWRTQTPAAKQPGVSTINIRLGKVEPLTPATTVLPPWPFYPLRLRSDRPKPAGYPQTPKTLGEHLKKARIDRQLTQRQAAQTIDVTQTSVCEWETGKRSPSAEFLPGIIRFLGYDPRSEPQTFGQQLARLRQDQGLSQRQLAKLIGVDPVTVSGWEAGRHQPARKQLAKLKRIFPALADVL